MRRTNLGEIESYFELILADQSELLVRQKRNLNPLRNFHQIPMLRNNFGLEI